jgi:hypothetical protein
MVDIEEMVKMSFFRECRLLLAVLEETSRARGRRLARALSMGDQRSRCGQSRRIRHRLPRSVGPLGSYSPPHMCAGSSLPSCTDFSGSVHMVERRRSLEPPVAAAVGSNPSGYAAGLMFWFT